MLLAPAISRAEQAPSENCRDCRPQKSRLLDTCTRKQTASLSPEEAARYCQWVVRVAPGQGARSRVSSPSKAPEDRAIRAAIAPFQAVQPAQIDSDRAGVLAERLGSPGGNYAIIALTKKAGKWRVESVTEVPAKH
jgi:hypothetical protein